MKLFASWERNRENRNANQTGNKKPLPETFYFRHKNDRKVFCIPQAAIFVNLYSLLVLREREQPFFAASES